MSKNDKDSKVVNFNDASLTSSDNDLYVKNFSTPNTPVTPSTPVTPTPPKTTNNNPAPKK